MCARTYERGAIVPKEGPNGAERSALYVTEVHVGRHMSQLPSVSNFPLGIVFQVDSGCLSHIRDNSRIKETVRSYNLHPVEILGTSLPKGATPSVPLCSPSCSSQGVTPMPAPPGVWGVESPSESVSGPLTRLGVLVLRATNRGHPEIPKPILDRSASTHPYSNVTKEYRLGGFNVNTPRRQYNESEGVPLPCNG